MHFCLIAANTLKKFLEKTIESRCFTEKRLFRFFLMSLTQTALKKKTLNNRT